MPDDIKDDLKGLKKEVNALQKDLKALTDQVAALAAMLQLCHERVQQSNQRWRI